MRDLLRLPALRRYLTAYATILAASYFSLVAISLLVYDRTNDPLAVALVLLVGEVIPGFIAPSLVARLDHRPSRITISASYALQAVGYGVLALLVLSGVDGAPLILASCAAVFVEGCSALLGRSLLRTAVAIYARAHGQERAANAAMNVAMGAGTCAGPILAGIVIATSGIGIGLLACAALLTVGALLIASYPSLPTSDPLDELAIEAKDVGRLRSAFAHLASEHRAVGVLLCGQVVAIAFFSVAAPVEVVLVRDLGGGGAEFGILLTLWGAGALASSTLYGARHGVSLPSLLALSTGALAVGFGILAIAPGLTIAYLGALVAGLGNGTQWVAALSLIQEATPDRLQARVTALLESGSSIAPALGFVAGGALATISPQVAFAAAGLAILLIVPPLYLAARTVARRTVKTQATADETPAFSGASA